LLTVARNWSNITSTILKLKERTTLDVYTDVETSMTYPEQVENDRLLRVSAQKKMTISIGNSWWSAWSATAVIPAGLANRVLGSNVPSVALASAKRPRTPTIKISPTRANGTTSINGIPHSRTTVRCAKPELKSNENTKLTDVVYHVRDDGTSLGSLGNLSTFVNQAHGQGTFGTQSNKNGLGVIERYQYFSPIWLDSPETGSVASIGIFLSWYSNATTPQTLDQLLMESRGTAGPMNVVTCTMSASYITAPAVVIQDKGRRPTQTDTVQNLALVPARNITLNVTGIDMLGDSAFAASGEAKKTPLPVDPYAVDLAAALTIGISNIRVRENYTMAYAGSILSDLPSISANQSVLERKDTLYAYGYTTNSTSVRLSLAVILAYCIVTIVFMIYILVTGYTSTAWNSAIELVVLALQSRRPEYPGHTAVGIDSLHTLNQGVGIRVNKDDELELVFASDRDLDSRGLRKIERNMVY
jgi:hypothetical protein